MARPKKKKKAAETAAGLITSGKVPLSTVRKMKISPTTAKQVQATPMKWKDRQIGQWAVQVIEQGKPTRVSDLETAERSGSKKKKKKTMKASYK